MRFLETLCSQLNISAAAAAYRRSINHASTEGTDTASCYTLDSITTLVVITLVATVGNLIQISVRTA